MTGYDYDAVSLSEKMRPLIGALGLERIRWGKDLFTRVWIGGRISMIHWESQELPSTCSSVGCTAA